MHFPCHSQLLLLAGLSFLFFNAARQKLVLLPLQNCKIELFCHQLIFHPLCMQSHFTEIYKWAMKNTPIPSHYTGWSVSNTVNIPMKIWQKGALPWWVRVTMQPSMFRTMRKRAPSKSICSTLGKECRWDGKTEPNGSWSGAFNFTMPRN